MGFVSLSQGTSMPIPISNHPYSASISSSASSSSSSLFSTDSASSQTSTSSTSSLQIVWESENVDIFSCGDSRLVHGSAPSDSGNTVLSKAPRRCPTKEYRCISDERCSQSVSHATAEGTNPTEPRKHPRRNSSSSTCQHQPPSLVRQSARKVNFVDNLVDSAAQIVEVIWPLSVVACRSDSALGGKGVLPLRTFIQETLRRSRTSYSTLQVALYYLIVLRPHVPKHDFTMEQPEDIQALRALQCGRRMFLAALILASKYLQDRNYSARAWSKISGLNTQEINTNEITFLSAVNWRLHISETVFQRWTDIVLKYTPSAPPPPSPTSSPVFEEDKPDWSHIIPVLTPELDTVDLDDMSFTCNRVGLKSTLESSPHSVSSNDLFSLPNGSNESTPMPMYNSIPRVLEPQPIAFNALIQPLPSIGRIATLPTPQLTPPTSGFATPAAGVGSFGMCSRRPSIGAAMAHAQNACTTRTTMDRWSALPPMQTINPILTVNSPSAQFTPSSSGYRRSSLARTCSSNSSPESMVSDNSSRSSRSSSISSVASLTSAPNQAKLAIQATCRSAKLHQRGREDVLKNYLPLSSAEDLTYLGTMDLVSSPESYTGPSGSVPDFSNFSLSTPRQTPVPCRRRDAAREAARNLRDTLINRQRSPEIALLSPAAKGRKRCRVSEDFSALQQQVRQLIACGEQKERSTGLEDMVSDSYFPPTVYPVDLELMKRAQSPTRLSPRRLPLQKEMGRKRVCCGEEAAVSIRSAGPGMWEGIL